MNPCNVNEEMVSDNIEDNKYIDLIRKLTQATSGLEEALLLIQSLSNEQKQLKEQVALLQKKVKHLEPYEQKIIRIKSRWYIKLPLATYRLLCKAKSYMYRGKDKAL